MRVTGIDHVQVAAPRGCEEAARGFYGGVLGLDEIEKPASLRERGGAWFACGAQQLHVGVADDFAPAAKAHPAFAVEGLDELAERLGTAGFPVEWDDALAGRRRFYSADPWGNRLEFVESDGAA